MVSLSASVSYWARIEPGRVAIVYDDQRVTYSGLIQRVEALAGLLHEKGVKPGEVVALLMKNSTAFLELSIAISRVGAVILPLNYRLSREEVEYIAGHAGTRLLFVDEELAPLAQGIAQRVVVDPESQKDGRRLCDGSTKALVPPAHPARPEDLFRLMYTSGTTDRPKGVMHTYLNLHWKSLDHTILLGLSGDDRALVVGPLYHVGAFDLPGVALFLLGGTLVILRDFDPGLALATIARERITCGWLAPVMLQRILTCPERHAHDLSSLKWIIGGGERTPEGRIREFASVFTSARYIDAYGLTETCSGDTFMEPGREIEKIGSVGRPTPHLQLEIRDESGRVLPAGVDGEICLRGPKVTAGYWRDPAKTAASFHPGGWFRTGDVGHLDDEGFLYLTDRMKDMIISGGENIASSEVERVLYLMPEIVEAVAVGLADEKWGERVVAVVVTRDGKELTLNAVQAHCRQHLAGFKVPKAVIAVPALPRNPSGKVLKRVLRDQLAVARPN